MPVEITCPKCASRMSLPEPAAGEQIHCLSCQAEFPAPNPPKPPALEIKLTLDEPSAASQTDLVPAPLPGPSEGTDGPARQEPRSPEPPRLREVCPACGAAVQSEMRRCYRCGERLTGLGWPEGDDEGRRQSPRRDCAPNRGPLLLVLGILGLVCFPVCGPVGLTLCLCAWFMGRADLARISAGTMDREGMSTVESAIICGKIGVPLNILWLLGGLAIWLFVDNSSEPAQPPHRPRFGDPPVLDNDKGKWDKDGWRWEKGKAKDKW